MKKVLLNTLLLFGTASFAQNTILIKNAANSQSIAPNSIIEMATTANANHQITFDVTNTGSTQQTYKAKRYDVTLNAGADAYFCFAGTCYGPSTLVSPDNLVLNAGQSASQLAGNYNMLVADLDEGSTVGLSVIKYTFFNVNTAADSVQLTVRYNGAPTNIKENGLNIQHVMLSPNPASQNSILNIKASGNSSAKISIYNSLGSIVSEEKAELIKGENKINLSLSNLNSGIYFVNIENNTGKLTKRLIVK
jgi:hypothetical protein